jgi:transcription elongation factor Elf1
MNCPKCGSAAQNITPVKQNPLKITAYGCPVCGHAFDGSGKPIVSNTKQLADVFKAATESQKTLQEVFGQTKLDPATRVALTAKLLEYGVQMWFDGLKQGLLLTAIQEIKEDGKTGSTEGNII